MENSLFITEARNTRITFTVCDALISIEWEPFPCARQFGVEQLVVETPNPGPDPDINTEFQTCPDLNQIRNLTQTLKPCLKRQVVSRQKCLGIFPPKLRTRILLLNSSLRSKFSEISHLANAWNVETFVVISLACISYPAILTLARMCRGQRSAYTFVSTWFVVAVVH